MILYHGTTLESAKNIIKTGINLSIGRRALDFGQGFYLTKDKGQAIKWAAKKGFPLKKTAIIVFEPCDMSSLNIKKYSKQDEEWQETVYQCRVEKKDIFRGIDIVIGPMADGDINSDLRDIEKKIITKKQFLERISHDIGFQVVLKTEESLKMIYAGKIRIQEVS